MQTDAFGAARAGFVSVRDGGGIFLGIAHQPRLSPRRVGLFRYAFQPLRADLARLQHPVVFSMHTGASSVQNNKAPLLRRTADGKAALYENF